MNFDSRAQVIVARTSLSVTSPIISRIARSSASRSDERREHGLSRSFIATTAAGRSINPIRRAILSQSTLHRVPETNFLHGIGTTKSSLEQRSI